MMGALGRLSTYKMTTVTTAFLRLCFLRGLERRRANLGFVLPLARPPAHPPNPPPISQEMNQYTRKCSISNAIYVEISVPITFHYNKQVGKRQ